MPKPKKSIINGEEVTLYFISDLAHALGRTPQAIRKWEVSGIIPKAIFIDAHDRRMYTEEQIDIIVKTAEECKIGQGKNIAQTSFSKKVYDRLEKHNERYFKSDTEEEDSL